MDNRAKRAKRRARRELRYHTATEVAGLTGLERCSVRARYPAAAPPMQRLQYVCQRCRTSTEVRAALRPPTLLPCPKCEGTRQAVRLDSGRETRKGLLKN
jgi:hypothetical protein